MIEEFKEPTATITPSILPELKQEKSSSVKGKATYEWNPKVYKNKLSDVPVNRYRQGAS